MKWAKSKIFRSEEDIKHIISGRSDPVSHSGGTQNSLVEDHHKLIAKIITELWRMKQKMTTPEGQPLEGMERPYRHLQSSLDLITDSGYIIRDHIGDHYDHGMLIKVIAFQPMADLVDETVVEAIKPTIFYNEQQIQRGEVIVGTPEDKK